MTTVPTPNHLFFSGQSELEHWLEANHADTPQLWVRIYRKDSGIASVDWSGCVEACLIWGWIDGTKRSLDALSYLQRLTLRRPRSTWSLRNRRLAERLIAGERMQPPGLAQVQSARANGRWDTAYAGSAAMEVPPDLLAALKANAEASAAFRKLGRGEIFRICLGLQTVRRTDTRRRRIEEIVRGLGER